MSEAQSYQAGNIDKDRVVYLASDFDNVTRLFLDAAERCIASERREKELQQRLTAADERLDQAVTALNEIARVSRMGEKPFEIATLAIGEISADIEQPAPSPSQLDYGSLDPVQRLAVCRGDVATPVAVVPDGYCIMPRQLTAENGAKALLLGEFKLLVTEECPECCELEEPAEGCSICDGEGEYGQKHTIPWDKIKFIYSKAVEGLAVKDETTKSR